MKQIHTVPGPCQCRGDVCKNARNVLFTHSFEISKTFELPAIAVPSRDRAVFTVIRKLHYCAQCPGGSELSFQDWYSLGSRDVGEFEGNGEERKGFEAKLVLYFVCVCVLFFVLFRNIRESMQLTSTLGLQKHLRKPAMTRMRTMKIKKKSLKQMQ